MRRPIYYRLIGVLSLLACLACADPVGLSGPYLGQTPPGPEPSLFAAGFVSTGMGERDVAITPDGNEFYFSRVLGGNHTFNAILVTRRVNDVWSEPEVASFSGQYMDLEPAIAPDGKAFYFMSKRPLPDSDDEMSDENLWMMDRTADGWGEPYPVGPPINSDQAEFFASVTLDRTLYFTRRGEDGVEKIYRSRLIENVYQPVEELPEQVNGARTQFNAFIAPDESYLIVCNFGHPDSLGGVDYFVVFRDADDHWSEPLSLGAEINTPTGQEWSPYVSIDGKYLFFMSSRTTIQDRYSPTRLSTADLQRMHNEPLNGNSDIWWVDAALLHNLRAGATFN